MCKKCEIMWNFFVGLKIFYTFALYTLMKSKSFVFHLSKNIINKMLMIKFNSIKTVACLTFAFFANVVVGQNVVITSNGNPVSNGDVIELPYEMEDYSIPGTIDYFVYTWNPRLEASTVKDEASLTVTVTSIDDTEGFQLCWPNGCQQVDPGKSATSSGTVTTTPKDLQIHKEVSFYEVGATPTEGGVVKVTCESGLEVIEITVKCLLSDSNAVGENIADPNQKAEYYTIQGIRVAEPQKGQIYIERKGSKVVKRIF